MVESEATGWKKCNDGQEVLYVFLRKGADRFGNVLFNSVLNPFGGMAYIPTVAVA